MRLELQLLEKRIKNLETKNAELEAKYSEAEGYLFQYSQGKDKHALEEIKDLTAKLTNAERGKNKLQDLCTSHANKLRIFIGEIAKFKERVAELENPSIEVKSIQCDRCGEILVNIPKLQLRHQCNDPAQGSGKL